MWGKGVNHIQDGTQAKKKSHTRCGSFIRPDKLGDQGRPAGLVATLTAAVLPPWRPELATSLRSSGACSTGSRGAGAGTAAGPGGTALLGACYGGGYGISCTVDDGVVSAPVGRVVYPNLHSVRTSSDGRFAYFVSLGADLIAQINAATGAQ